MTEYRAPIAQMRFTLDHLGEFGEVVKLDDFSAVDSETVDAVLEEAAKFAAGVLAPINTLGDEQGVSVVDDAVVVPKEFTDAYKQFCEAGWPGIASNPDFGGQGFPKTVSVACDEMWAAANVSFALCPELSQGAILALGLHATDELKQTYLEKLVSGEWAGTMCLTEPQAGSDLGPVATRAEPAGDGRYLISGQKVYITWGDQPMSENIIHLVLARLPDAPKGTRGISLFLVPKYKVNDDGSVGERNDVKPVSVEHKMGIHASPTTVLLFGDSGGAEGYLVGKENEGLAAMFTMMNYMRLGVGVQGVGLADASYQTAVKYANDRVQGSVPGQKGSVSIIHHGDVRRMLLLMATLTQAGRGICIYTASCLDRGSHGADAELAARMQARAELLTPIAKAWPTEASLEATSLGIQVHGGMGYCEESGAPQFYRDSRIAPIYEGTNSIQAMDLLGRKVLRDGGTTISEFVSEMRSLDADLANAGEEMDVVRKALGQGLDEIVRCTTYVMTHFKSDPNLLNAGAFNYLMLVGTVVGGWQLARGALAARAEQAAGNGDKDFLEKQVVFARFYAEQVMPRNAAYSAAVQAGSGSIMALSAEQF